MESRTPNERRKAHATDVLVRRRRTRTPTDEGVGRGGKRIVLNVTPYSVEIGEHWELRNQPYLC
jgi:hypothetical protein